MTARGKLCCLSDLQRCTARVTGNFFDLHASLPPAQEFLDKNLSILQTHAEFIGSQKKVKYRAALRYTFKTRSLQNRNSRMHMAELTVKLDTKSLSSMAKRLVQIFALCESKISQATLHICSRPVAGVMRRRSPAW